MHPDMSMDETSTRPNNRNKIFPVRGGRGKMDTSAQLMGEDCLGDFISIHGGSSSTKICGRDFIGVNSK